MCDLFIKFRNSFSSIATFEHFIQSLNKKSLLCRESTHCKQLCTPAFNCLVEHSDTCSDPDFFLHAVQSLFRHKFEPLECDRSGQDAIMCALALGKFGMAQFLLEKISLVFDKDERHAELINYLLEILPKVSFRSKWTEVHDFLRFISTSDDEFAELFSLCRFLGDTIAQLTPVSAKPASSRQKRKSLAHRTQGPPTKKGSTRVTRTVAKEIMDWHEQFDGAIMHNLANASVPVEHFIEAAEKFRYFDAKYDNFTMLTSCIVIGTPDAKKLFDYIEKRGRAQHGEEFSLRAKAIAANSLWLDEPFPYTEIKNRIMLPKSLAHHAQGLPTKKGSTCVTRTVAKEIMDWHEQLDCAIQDNLPDMFIPLDRFITTIKNCSFFDAMYDNYSLLHACVLIGTPDAKILFDYIVKQGLVKYGDRFLNASIRIRSATAWKNSLIPPGRNGGRIGKNVEKRTPLPTN